MSENSFLKRKEAIENFGKSRSVGIPSVKRNENNTHRANETVSHENSDNSFTAPLENTKISLEQFDDYDDEEAELYARKNNQQLSTFVSNDDPVLNAISENIKKLNKQYPTGGIKASRYITADVLINSPAGFFDKYEDTVQEGVAYVRASFGESDRASIISQATNNPTNEAYQDHAFYAVSSQISEFATRSQWRDIHKKIVQALITNEVLGFGRLEPLWRDRRIDEIICNGPYDIQAEINGELTKVPGCRFKDQTHLMGLIERLYSSINKTVTITTPLVKGRLHDKSRMYVIHPSVAPDGPNLNIRRHPEGFWTPKELVKTGSAPEELMAFIGNLIYKGASILVVGGTSSGKTSLLNALTGFYKPKVRVVTLEDNLEMKPNPKKFLSAAMECRQSSSDSDTAVTMRDLVKSSLQMRPDAIIVGEVTDEAAFDLAQALNTGHAGASTIHANTAQDAIPRVSSLIAQGGLATITGSLDMIASAFDVIIVTKHFPVDGSRRIVSVSEVGTNPITVNGRLTLETIPLWRFVDEGLDENRKVQGHWEKVNDLSEERVEQKLLNIEDDLSWDELTELSSLPEGYITHSKSDDA